MNTLFKTLIAALVITAFCGTINAKDIMKLNEKQQCLSAIACLEAKGDLDGLRKAIDDGLNEGLTVSQVKEALSQLYAYTGFPRSLNSLGVLQQVVEARNKAGRVTDEGVDATPLPADYDALRQGTEVQTKLTGRAFNYDFAPATDYYLKAHLFGDIFARDNLTHAERELVTVSALSGLEGVMPQLTAHTRGALNMGVTREQLSEIPLVLKERVGLVEAERCAEAVSVTLGTETPEAKLQRAIEFRHGIATSPYPIGAPNTGYAQYFIGNSYVAPLDAENGGPVNVTFEPRCRNNWHVHHKAVQVLICVAGRGWYQEWGKDPVEMTPGTVIAIPAEAKHWHGAAADSWFQHLTYHTRMEAGSSNEWLEPVTDEVYDKLP